MRRHEFLSNYVKKFAHRDTNFGCKKSLFTFRVREIGMTPIY
jgi:hypothetical protein